MKIKIATNGLTQFDAARRSELPSMPSTIWLSEIEVGACESWNWADLESLPAPCIVRQQHEASFRFSRPLGGPCIHGEAMSMKRRCFVWFC